MARTTTNYGLNISEGTDLVNPLTDIFPNFETLDTDLKDVSDSAVGSATELLTGTVHALTRADSDRDIFTFTATSNFEAGETFTLDGVQVTALTPDGQTLSTGCYIIGSEVLCAVKGTLVTFYVNPSKALDSDKLDGHDSSYFATDSDLDAVAQDVSDISDKVGTGVLQTTAQDCVGAINEVNSKLLDKATIVDSIGNVQNKVYINSYVYPASQASVNLPLPSGMFTSTPMVFATMGTAGGYTVAITTESTTQFTAYVRLNNSVPTDSTTIKVIAIGV